MALMILLASGYWDEMAELFKLVPFPERMHTRLVFLIIFDFAGSFAIDRFLRMICGKAKNKKIRVKTL